MKKSRDPCFRVPRIKPVPTIFTSGVRLVVEISVSDPRRGSCTY